MRGVVVAAWLTLVGCKGGTSAAECKTETEQLVKLLRGADRPEPHPYGLTLELDADGITSGDRRIALEAVIASLAESQKHLPMRLRREFGEGTGVVFVRIDDNVPWSRVVELADKLAAGGFDHPTLLASRPPKSEPPPRTPIDDKLDKQLAADRSGGNDAATIAKTMSELITSCKPLDKVFGTISAEEGDKAEILLVGLSESLPACNCDVDMPALRSVLYRVYQDPHPTTSHKIVLAKAGTPVAFPAATRWKDAATRLPEGGTVWLVAN